MNPELSAACQISDLSFKVNRVNDANYILDLLELAEKNEVGIIVPTIDTELLILAENRNLFAKHGIQVVISDAGIISMCRNKRFTHQFFLKQGFKIAKEYGPDNFHFPLFVKPVDGSCSKNIFVFRNQNEINPSVLSDPNMMLLEYIDKQEYDEYTVDLYYSKDSSLCCVVPRLRMEIRSGEVSKSCTIKNAIISMLRMLIPKVDGMRGCITLQLFMHKKSDEIIGIEINPRFGGGYPLSYMANANFPGWIIDEYLLNIDIRYYEDWEDSLLMLRFDDEILVKNYAHRK